MVPVATNRGEGVSALFRSLALLFIMQTKKAAPTATTKKKGPARSQLAAALTEIAPEIETGLHRLILQTFARAAFLVTEEMKAEAAAKRGGAK